MIREKVASKLYIQGEYSILNKNHKAIILKVNKFMKASIEFSDEYYVYSDLCKNPVDFSNIHPRYKYIIEILEIIEEYLKEIGIKPKPVKICFETELYEKGKKIGFGSSAATIVLMVKIFLKLYKIKFSRYMLFKLSTVISYKLGSNGSMGDIATISFNSSIVYNSFDYEKIKKEIEESKIQDIITKKWEYLEIKPIYFKDIKFYFLWTGDVARTRDMVRKILSYKEDQFFKEIDDNIQKLVNDTVINRNILDNMIKNNELLKELGEKTKTNIVTFKIKKIIDVCKKYGFSYKISGAGGGDCLIIASKNNKNIRKIAKELFKKRLIKKIGKI